MLATQTKKILNDITIEDFAAKWIQNILTTINNRLILFHSKRYKDEIGSIDVLATSFIQARDYMDIGERILYDIVKSEFATLKATLTKVYGEQSKEVRLYNHFLFLENNLSNFAEMDCWEYNFSTIDGLVSAVMDWEEKHEILVNYSDLMLRF